MVAFSSPPRDHAGRGALPSTRGPWRVRIGPARFPRYNGEERDWFAARWAAWTNCRGAPSEPGMSVDIADLFAAREAHRLRHGSAQPRFDRDGDRARASA